MSTTNDSATDQPNVQDLVIERDTGARAPAGLSGWILTATAFCWAVFQCWISSPLPFELGVLIFNDTESRAIHLGFAMFLAFTAYPTFVRSPRSYIPIQDWLAALLGAGSAVYLFVFYQELASRPGLPSETDIWVSCVGIVLLLEAARRSLGLPLMIVGGVFLLYSFFGSAEWLPDIIRYKGASFNKIASHQWLSTEGVFGIALGVSTSFVFLFVLLGSLLDKAGAGNYFIKVAFSLLGHLRGGPAKAAVLASGLTGFISGSSIANVVTTGTFTIPLMKRVGFTAEKAGAVEVAGSVNGQIMPPVMGAAAFIMMDFIGISLNEVIRHAFLPAVISYIALLYIVHLEALKTGMQALEKPVVHPLKRTLITWGIIIASLIIVIGAVHFGLNALKSASPELAPYVILGGLAIWYLLTLRYAARYPDLEPDDPDAEVVTLPETGPTVKTGLHYLIPVVVLVWSLMVERLSPGLSAFWASVVMMVILITQKPLLCFFRKEAQMKAAFHAGLADLKDGMIAGARNMIGIGIATAAAGIVVGTVTLTGLGPKMTEIVQQLSGGSMLLALVFTAVISLILGMGLPTTANYVVVASLMVGVVQELGQLHGLIVPAIAVHLFVFYFGIMADVTPPVGLASFASAAISKGDPIKTGIQAFVYSTRTAILPFFFIYNNSLLLIGVETFAEGLFIFVTATIGILVFSAAMQGYFMSKSRPHESVALLLVAMALFVPQLFMDRIYPPTETVPGTQLLERLETAKPGDTLKVLIEGEDMMGDRFSRYVMVPVLDGSGGAERLEKFGLIVRQDGSRAFVDDVVFMSQAEEKKIDFDYEIRALEVATDRPDARWLYVPAMALLMMIIWLQRRRQSKVYLNL